MMRRIALAGLVCSALAAAPMNAALHVQTDSQSVNTVTTPAQDLDCVLWASYTLGSLGENADPSAVLGLSVAVGWFTGLYEGKTGKPVNAALKARGEMVGEADIAAMRSVCVARMSVFSKRLQAFGN